MIEKVQFRNFKAYRSLDLELEPFTVLVGPNASGKTTLLEGLHLLSTVVNAMLAGGKDSWPGPPVQSHGVQSPVELGALGGWNGMKGMARAISAADWVQRKTFRELPFGLACTWGGQTFWIGDSRLKPSANMGPLTVGDLEAIQPLRAGLSATAILRFVPGRLAEASYSEELVPSMSTDGSGLASVLAYLKLSEDEVFARIEGALKLVVPAVRRIRIERATVELTAARIYASHEQDQEIVERRTLWGNQIVFDMRGAKGVSPGAAGEGTLMVLGLLTALMGPSKPRLVLLDDIELSLHPAAQARLVDALRTIQKNDPGLQIIATSHSPFILNYLRPEEVRMTFLAENGFARCEKLTAHPEFEKWKGLMAPGEFWSTVGEEWIGKLGGAAANE
ncbi:AAA family ATPase [Pyxidicoccus xibeiensis]|uniref:AAA family ATPase n=1 Tax=Pyxidicoccus xibeiensis TaxID=2906759 RepID=UPI0020A7ECDD|nr:AAA family ATPase [Pyxidicoccus xibeiensis]MCP3136321.1 AAA family ATPase [Pyxidicoccus xibeiensis]